MIEETEPDVSGLIDLLANRVGERNLYRIAPVASDVPERDALHPGARTGDRAEWPGHWPRPRVCSPIPSRSRHSRSPCRPHGPWALIIDGEVCAVRDGLPSFAGLTDALSAKRAGLVYYMFDMMAGNGQNLMARRLLARKDALQEAIDQLRPGDKMRVGYVDHHAGEGAAMYVAACKMGLEGLVSKVIDAPYKPGDRSRLWTKAKCRASQELVVAGWKTTGAAFRSLVGAFRDGASVQVGTVGTGYNSRNLPALLKALKRRASDRPFENRRDTGH